MPSKSRELQKRRDLIRKLYVIEGFETRDIAEKLLGDGTLKSRSFESALKTVRNEVAEIKREMREDVAANEDEGSAKERHINRLLYTVRKLIALIEDDSFITKVVGYTKDGPITSEVPAVPVAVKQKAMKDLAAISERLAVVTGVEVGKLEPKGDREAAETSATEFTFNFSGSTLDSLISARRGVVN
jgi:hypothetical protein